MEINEIYEILFCGAQDKVNLEMNGIKFPKPIIEEEDEQDIPLAICENCGKLYAIIYKKKPKQTCSYTCRNELRLKKGE